MIKDLAFDMLMDSCFFGFWYTINLPAVNWP